MVIMYVEVNLEHVEHNNEAVSSQPPVQLLPLPEVENDNINLQNVESSTSQWRHYTPAQLHTPVNTALKSSRRRPTPMVKALTSSEVAEKYNILLDRRLSIGKITED